MRLCLFLLLTHALPTRPPASRQFWRARSQVYGSDATWGAAAVMAAHAKPPITELEIEGGMQHVLLDRPMTVTYVAYGGARRGVVCLPYHPVCLLLSLTSSPPPPPPKLHQRRTKFVTDYYRQYPAIEELKGTDFFKAMDNDPKKAIFMSAFGPTGRLYEAGNAVFEETFMPTVEFLGNTSQNKTINTLLFAALMAPEDRILWFRTALGMALTPANRAVHFVKVGKLWWVWCLWCTCLQCVCHPLLSSHSPLHNNRLLTATARSASIYLNHV